MEKLSQERALEIVGHVYGFCTGYYGDEFDDINENPLEYYRDGQRQHIPGDNARADAAWNDPRWDTFQFRLTPEGFEAEWWERGEIVIAIFLRPDGGSRFIYYYGQTMSTEELKMDPILTGEEFRAAT
jgi:hypothetical protein